MNRFVCAVIAIIGYTMHNAKDDVKINSVDPIGVVACSSVQGQEQELYQEISQEVIDAENGLNWLCIYETPSPNTSTGLDAEQVTATATPQVAEVTSYGSSGSAFSYGSTGYSYAPYVSSSLSYGSSGSSFTYGSSGSAFSYGSTGPIRRVLSGVRNIFTSSGSGKSLANSIADSGQVYHDASYGGRENVYFSSSGKIFGHRIDARRAWRQSEGHRANLPMLGLRVSRGASGVSVVGRR